jgi:hypothetical protein
LPHPLKYAASLSHGAHYYNQQHHHHQQQQIPWLVRGMCVNTEKGQCSGQLLLLLLLLVVVVVVVMNLKLAM